MIAPTGRLSARSPVAVARNRSLQRLLNDPHVLVSGALVVAAVGAGIVGRSPALGALVGSAFVLLLLQVILAQGAEGILARSRRHTVRLVAMLIFVGMANALLGPPGLWPVPSLFLPIVALAAALGRREATWVSALAIVLTALPLILVREGHDQVTIERAIALFVAGIVLIVGTRRTVSALEDALAAARRLLAADRRRSAQLAAVDEVSRLLAASGPTHEVLDRIIGLFERRLGYEYVSIYLGDDKLVRMGAQVGYPEPILEFDRTQGVTGRTMRTRELQYIPDIRLDPDYRSAQAVVGSEICAPLLAGDEFLGTINVESASALDSHDVAAVRLVADRIAAALALAHERNELADRAEVFRRLIGFASSVTGTLDAESVHTSIVEGIRALVASEIVTLTTLDPSTGRYVVRAGSGLDPRYLGVEVTIGEGMVGRAIRDRAIVVDDRWERARFPRAALDRVPPDEPTPDVLAGIGVPLLRDDVVVGGLTLVRSVDRPFDVHEREILQIVAGQAALAVSNAALLAQVTESSLRDPLTGLYNRRFLDATLERMEAVRARQEPAVRPTASAILFDLDHFGALNKRHGHQVGDAVLRGFAEVLRARARASDVVARYGGEEFLVVLEGASKTQAVRLADTVRRRFAALRFEGAGEPVAVTVSAGCAATDDSVATLFELVRVADAGLAMAKRGGRDQVVAV